MEIKTGYGLSREHELRMLSVIAQLKELLPIEIEATYLGAHVVPEGVERADYVQEVARFAPQGHGSRGAVVRRVLR